MSRISSVFRKWPATLLYLIVVPAFFLSFMLIYRPYGSGVLLEMGRGLFTFNVTILSSIVLVTIALSRLVLWLVSRRIDTSWTAYILWCMAEALAMSLFGALYITLMLRGAQSYFSVLAWSLGCMLSISIYPYAVITLALQLKVKAEQASHPAVQDASMIRFHDTGQRLKLVISPAAVLYIKAEENYVSIHYTDNGRLKKYVLRASMRSLEELAAKHGLVRCQRSFYINPDHIRIIRREPGGIVAAELDIDGAASIPVSRKYYENLSAFL